MANVGRANVEITADSGQAQREIKGVTGLFKNMGSIAAGVMGGLALFETVKSTFTGLWNSTIGMNASMEQYRNTLTIVQGSAEKANETLEWATKFAAATPYEIPELVEATTRLEAYGLTAQDVLGTTGDMASAMGKPLMQAVEAIADAQTGELERLKEFGITKQMLIDQAAEMGLGEVVNAKGQITNQEALNEALFALMNDRYEGAMEIQSTTFTGMISNIKDSMGQMASALSQPIFDSLKGGLESVVPVMGAFTQVVQGDWAGAKETLVDAFGEDTALQIENAFLKIFRVFHELKEFVISLYPVWDNLKAIFISLLPIFGQVGGAIAVVWNVISENLPPVLDLITKFAAIIVGWEGFIPIILGLVGGIVAFKTGISVINGVTSSINFFKTSFAALNAVIKANPVLAVISLLIALGVALVSLYNNSETFRNAVNSIWEFLKGVFVSLIEFFTETIPGWWNSLITGITNLWNSIVGWFTTAYEFVSAWIMNLWTSVVGFFQGIFDGIMAILQPFIDFFLASWENLKLMLFSIITLIVTTLTGNFEGMKVALLGIWTAIKEQALAWWNLLKDTVIQVVVNLWNGIVGWVTSIYNSVVEWFTKMKNSAVEKISELWNGVVNWFVSLPSTIAYWITTAYNNVVEWFTKIKNKAIELVTNMFNGVIEWIVGIPGEFVKIGGEVVSALSEIDLWQVAKDVVNGFIGGIGDMAGAVWEGAKSLGNSLVGGLTSMLGISSPSKVTWGLGLDTGEGMILGLDDKIREAERKARELAAAVASEMEKESANLNLGATISGIEGQMNQNSNLFDQVQGAISPEQHVHYWQLNADEITDVSRLIDIVDGIVQTVRSR